MGQGKVFVDPNDDCVLIGENTASQNNARKGVDWITEFIGNCQIASIEDDTHLTLTKPFGSKIQKFNPELIKPYVMVHLLK